MRRRDWAVSVKDQVHIRNAEAAPSGHPAQLNFGDSLSYAVAAVMRAPLLFKERDFGLTDVMSHPASIRA